MPQVCAVVTRPKIIVRDNMRRRDGWQERMKRDAEQLARRCRWLEEQCKEVNLTNVISKWEDPPKWKID
jgi:hypothetical protein